MENALLSIGAFDHQTTLRRASVRQRITSLKHLGLDNGADSAVIIASDRRDQSYCLADMSVLATHRSFEMLDPVSLDVIQTQINSERHASQQNQLVRSIRAINIETGIGLRETKTLSFRQ